MTLTAGMDSLPTTPSSPASTEHPAPSIAPTLPVPRNPFSAPIDDDASFENQSHFPLNRHPKVVLQDMSIKKSKSASKSRSNSNATPSRSILSRHPTLDPLTSPPQSQLPDLPHPLPLRTLCQNRIVSFPSSQVSVKISPPRSPPRSSSAWKDSFGCTHLGASDCDLSIVFLQSSHFEVWDVSDDTYIDIPVMLYIMAKDAHAWSGRPLALPDVALLDIRCNDIPIPARARPHIRPSQYSTHYYGPLIMPKNSINGMNTFGPSYMPSEVFDRIVIDSRWMHAYCRPTLAPNGRGSIVRRDEAARANARAAGIADARAWSLQIFIPIPTSLFTKRETRSFQITARVSITRDGENGIMLDEKDTTLVADAQMTVSHLRTPREMDGVWWC